MIFILPAPVFFGLTVQGLGFVPSIFVTAIIAAMASLKMKLPAALLLALAVTLFSTLSSAMGLACRSAASAPGFRFLRRPMELLSNLALALPPPPRREPVVLPDRRAARHADRRAAGHRPHRDHRDAAADHLPARQPVSSLIMLAGIYYGAQYGGSTTAILINMPGETSSAVTAIDGYQMARKGRAGAALAIAAIGSFFAGTVATLLIAIFRAAADRYRAEIRRGRIFLADRPRPRVVDRAGAWLDPEGAGDGRARPAARPCRHRHLYRHAALHVRHHANCRRHQLRRGRGRRLRHRRNPAQSRERARPRGADAPRSPACCRRATTCGA